MAQGFLPLTRAVALFVVVLAGCAPRPPEPAAPAPVNDPLVILERQVDGTRTLRARFSFSARTAAGRSESGRGALVLARPDRLRLQLFSLGFMTVYDYTTKDGRWRVRLPLEGVTRSGGVEDGAPSGDRARAEDLRLLFFREEARAAEIVREGSVARVRLENGREVVVSLAKGVVVGETVPIGEDASLHVRYADFRSVDGLALPFRIEVGYPDERVSLTIEVDDYQRNVEVDEALFTI